VPVEFHRRGGEEQRSAEIVDGKARFGDGFPGSSFGQFVGQRACALRAGGEKIHRAGDAGVELIHREAGDRMDAGLAGSQRFPVVLLADAERGHHADAGDGHDGTSKMIRELRHVRLRLQSDALTSAMPSKW
jgi:hypothetical protein